jgi:transposase
MATMDVTSAQPQGPFELVSRTLGAAPIVRRFCERLGLEALLERYLPAGDRCTLSPARAIMVLICNLAISREPLYGLGEWVARHDACALGLAPGDAQRLNDDRAGRALDQLFDCDRASLLTELVVGVISEFRIDCSQLHNDSTSICLHGAYEAADGRPRGGKPTVVAARGHSKDHRPDLKQLVLTLTVAADGAVPIAHRLLDGNTNDDLTHIATWEGLVGLTGRVDFLYVADAKLATREQMAHISGRGGRFVSVLPKSRAEYRRLCEWIRASEPEWTEAARRPARRQGLPDEVWSVAPAPLASDDGYRLVCVHSTQKRELDEQARADCIARALGALDRLSQRLAGPKCRFREREQVEQAARAALVPTHAAGLIRFTVSDWVQEWVREESRGPGRKPAHRRLARKRFALTWQVDEHAVADQAACDGFFPIISNAHERSDAELLTAYRYQPNLEKRHHQLKSVLQAAPVTLKSASRIEGLACCEFIALLCQCLIERELRAAMAREGVPELALYHERRPAKAPTAARVFDLFADTTRHRLLRDGQIVQTFEPQLSDLQLQLLELLDVPDAAYLSRATNS